MQPFDTVETGILSLASTLMRMGLLKLSFCFEESSTCAPQQFPCPKMAGAVPAAIRVSSGLRCLFSQRFR
jgi:hypothetical protein